MKKALIPISDHLIVNVFITNPIKKAAKTSLKERSFAEAWKELVAQTEKVCCSPACIHCANKKICHPCIAMIAAECGEEKGCPEYLCRMHAAEAEVYQAVLEKWKSGCGNAEVFPVLF